MTYPYYPQNPYPCPDLVLLPVRTDHGVSTCWSCEPANAISLPVGAPMSMLGFSIMTGPLLLGLSIQLIFGPRRAR